MGIIIRSAVDSDLRSITEIYDYYILNSAITFDLKTFSKPQRQNWFSQYSSSGSYRCFVAEIKGEVIGYCTSSLFRTKQAYKTSVETSIYLSSGVLGNGIGSKLYAVLFDSLCSQGLHRAYAGITLPNERSLHFHKKFKFQSIGKYTEVGYKFDQYWDVEWFEKEIE